MWLIRYLSDVALQLAISNKHFGMTLVAVTLVYCFFPWNAIQPNQDMDRGNRTGKISSGRNDSDTVWVKRVAPQLRFFNSSKAFSGSHIPLLEELGITEDRDDFVDLSQPLPNVTFVTAISENHAGEGRSLIKRMAKDHPDWRIYIYDMGLNTISRIFFENACNVAGVRDLDLAHYGMEGDLISYRFKPIVIAKAMKEFPIVFWIDTSTFFAPNMTINSFVEKINITESEDPHVYLIATPTGHSTYAVTSAGMYDYLAPQGNIYLPQYAANKSLFVRTKSTIQNALKWYVLCALEPICMAPQNSQLICSFSNESMYAYAHCHRYDQSAINLVLSGYPKSFLDVWSTQYAWTTREVQSDAWELSIAVNLLVGPHLMSLGDPWSPLFFNSRCDLVSMSAHLHVKVGHLGLIQLAVAVYLVSVALSHMNDPTTYPDINFDENTSYLLEHIKTNEYGFMHFNISDIASEDEFFYVNNTDLESEDFFAYSLASVPEDGYTPSQFNYSGPLRSVVLAAWFPERAKGKYVYFFGQGYDNFCWPREVPTSDGYPSVFRSSQLRPWVQVPIRAAVLLGMAFRLFQAMLIGSQRIHFSSGDKLHVCMSRIFTAIELVHNVSLYLLSNFLVSPDNYYIPFFGACLISAFITFALKMLFSFWHSGLRGSTAVRLVLLFLVSHAITPTYNNCMDYLKHNYCDPYVSLFIAFNEFIILFSLGIAELLDVWQTWKLELVVDITKRESADEESLHKKTQPENRS